MRISITRLAALAALCPTWALAQEAPHFQTDFPLEELAARRQKVLDRIGNDAVAVVPGAPAGGSFMAFRQTNEFYYLCGVEVPHAYLLLDGRRGRTTLYLPPRDAGAERSEGGNLSPNDPDQARELTGIDSVRGIEQLGRALARATVVYAPFQPAEGQAVSRDEATRAIGYVVADPWDGRPTRTSHFVNLLRSRYPRADVRDLSPILDEMRVIKSQREIALLRRAGDLAARGLIEAMKSTRPGLREFHLAAAARYVFLAGGARDEGYRAIAASGANVWYGHYFRNDSKLKSGDWILMDHAPDYGYYTSDIGRMWPVSGRYSPLQRELYGFIVKYHKTLLRLTRPGVSANQVMDEAAREMRQVVEKTRFSKPIYEQAARRTLRFRGHLSHPVGMAVHDVGSYRKGVLKPGMVFAVDPQMWVPEEKLYIRAEDTVVVTEDGIETFTARAPLELEDVEALMQEDGVIQKVPPLPPLRPARQ